MLKYKYTGEKEHQLAGVPGLIKPGVPFEVTPKQAEGLERHGRDEYEPVLDEEKDEPKPKKVEAAPAEQPKAKAAPPKPAPV
jgi:hypothetical protein